MSCSSVLEKNIKNSGKRQFHLESIQKILTGQKRWSYIHFAQEYKNKQKSKKGGAHLRLKSSKFFL